MARPVLAVLPLGWAVLPAQAQMPVPATLDAVTVTSMRQNQTPFETPASVDLIDGESLREAQPQVNLSEGLGAVPGLVLQNRQNYAQDLQLSIRGFGARSTFGIRGVRLYVDGVPATMPDGQGQSANIDIASIERVEVLRGPFSALYGNSSGGVVQVFTEAGESPATWSGGLILGSEGLRRYNVKGRGATESVDGLFSASRFETDGVRAHSAAERTTGNARIGVVVSDASQLTLVLNDVRIAAQDPLGLTAAQFKEDPYQATPEAGQYNTRKTVAQTQGGLVWERAIDADNDLRLMVYAGQRQTQQFQAIPSVSQTNNAGHAGGVIDLVRDYSGLDARWTTRGGPLTLIGGLSVDALIEARRGYENFIGTELGVQGTLRRDEVNRVSNLDPYVQARWQLAPAWSAEAGLRYSNVRFESDDRHIVAGNGDDSGSVRYSQALPVAALRWQARDGLSFYAATGRGFETPTFNELAYRADGQPGLNFDLRPAVSTSVEIGVKQKTGEDTDYPGRGLLTAALFQTRTEDEIVTAGNSGGRATYQNAGRTLRQGLELGWAGRWGAPGAQYWRAEAAYTWLDATYRDGFAAGSAAQPGKRIPGIARNVAQLGLAWAPPVGWRAGMQARYTDDMAVNDANTEFAGASATLALYAGHAWRPASSQWEVSSFARVDNVTDEVYAGSVIVNEGNGRYYESAPGRNWSTGLNASYRF